MMREETKERFDVWWKGGQTDRPLVRLIARKKDPPLSEDLSALCATPFDFHLNPEFRVKQVRNSLVTHCYELDAFPYVDLNLGPGSMASYLCCEPGFSFDTIWYNEANVQRLSDLEGVGFERSTHWWYDHLSIIQRAVQLAKGDFPICIPDIQENLDIVSAMRGAQNLCFNLMDEPDEVKKIQAIVDRDFYKYYDAMYDAVKDENGDSAFTAFSIWGRGKTAKLQCDFSALISVEIFDEFVLPALRRQCESLDNTMYHLDGVGAIRHLDSVLSIPALNALQWTPGAGQEDGGAERWFPLYDKVRDAGKSLWIQIYDGDIDEWIRRSKNVIQRYGVRGIYFVYGETDEKSAKKLIHELHF